MWSRRALIKSVAGSTIAIGTAGISSTFTVPAFGSDETLAFRKGAAPLKLHFNENSAGMSPMAITAAKEAATNLHNRYPDAVLGKLRQTIAAQEGVSHKSIILGSGSTEILYMTVGAAAQQGATIIDTTPTFGEVRSYGARLGMPVKLIPVRSDFKTDLEAMKAAANSVGGPVLINLCNPNNPTGTIIPEADLAGWISEAPANHMFLIDEAYFDYANAETAGYGSMVPLVKAGHDNLIVSRTFSKVHGMAGLRVGYAVATEMTAKRVSSFTNVVNVNVAGAAAAHAALQDETFYKSSLSSNQKAKAEVISTLNALELEYIPSSTNFILHRINSTVADYQRRMEANGIQVGRRMTKEDGWNRISLGTAAEMQQFTRTLKAFREKGWV
ncbi:MAG: histidinol-phosphate transaminase [Kordiimonas sp.]